MKKIHDLILLKPLNCLCATNYIETVFQMTNGRITNISCNKLHGYLSQKTEVQMIILDA